MAESLSGALSAPTQGKEILGPPDIARPLFRIAHDPGAQITGRRTSSSPDLVGAPLAQ